MIFKTNKDVVFFYTSDYSGVNGIIKHSTFSNHKTFIGLQYDYFFEALNEDRLNEVPINLKNIIKKMFIENSEKKFNKKYFDLFVKLKGFNKGEWYFQNYVGKNYVLKIDFRLENYFNNDYEKYYVYRNPLITYILSKSVGNFDEENFINSLQLFQKHPVFLNKKFINYDDFLFSKEKCVLSNIDKKYFNLEFFNEAINILNNNNISYDYINYNYLKNIIKG